MTQPGRGWGRVKGVKFCPLSDSGDPYSIRTIKQCSLPLSSINKSEQLTNFEGSKTGVQGPILDLGDPIPDFRGPVEGLREALRMQFE